MTEAPRSGGTPAAAPAVDWDGIATAALQQKHAVDPRYFSPEFVLAMVDAHRELEAALGALSGVAPEPSAELWMAMHNLERAVEELNRPQAEWRWDELRLVEIAFAVLRNAGVGAAGRGSAGPELEAFDRAEFCDFDEPPEVSR